MKTAFSATIRCSCGATFTGTTFTDTQAKWEAHRCPPIFVRPTASASRFTIVQPLGARA